jgi:hypothetical protein
MFQSDLLSKDAEWFSRPGRLLAPRCAPAGANAMAEGSQPATGTVALGHTECDVVRGIGAPNNVSLSNNPRGDRVAMLTWSNGSRAGIYTFTGGRLTSIERGADPVAPSPKVAKSKAKKKPDA